MSEEITVYLREDELRAVLAVVGPIVSGDPAREKLALGRAEFALDSALLEYEQQSNVEPSGPEMETTPADAPKAGEVWIDGYSRRHVVTHVIGSMVYVARPDMPLATRHRSASPIAPSEWRAWTREQHTDPRNRRVTR